jgi:hypothetical protein
MWELARACDRFHGLPLEGGVAEQPYGALVRIRALLDYARAHAIFQAQGNNAPLETRQLVYRVMRAAAAN